MGVSPISQVPIKDPCIGLSGGGGTRTHHKGMECGVIGGLTPPACRILCGCLVLGSDFRHLEHTQHLLYQLSSPIPPAFCFYKFTQVLLISKKSILVKIHKVISITLIQ